MLSWSTFPMRWEVRACLVKACGIWKSSGVVQGSQAVAYRQLEKDKTRNCEAGGLLPSSVNSSPSKRGPSACKELTTVPSLSQSWQSNTIRAAVRRCNECECTQH